MALRWTPTDRQMRRCQPARKEHNVTSSVVGLIDLHQAQPPHISSGCFIPSDRVLPPVLALKPIESPGQLWDILDEQRARVRKQAADDAEARQAAPARQAEILAHCRHEQALAETRSYLAGVRTTLENLRPPVGTREQL